MNSFPLNPRLVVHHMAALDGDYPPNSLEAIRVCLEANVQFVEVDITALIADDYLLVHDPILETETNGTGFVSECTPEVVRTLLYKSSSGQTTSYRVALLSDVVALFQQYPGETRLQLDFKNVIPFRDDEPLKRLVKLIEPINKRVIVSAGADWQLRRLHKLAPWLDLGFDVQFYIDWRCSDEITDPRLPPYKQGAYEYWDDHPLATHRYWLARDYLAERCEMLMLIVPGVSTFYIKHTLLLQSIDDGFNWAEALHQAGIKLNTWTLDVYPDTDTSNIFRLLEAGVDQFTTNTPRKVIELRDAFQKKSLIENELM